MSKRKANRMDFPQGQTVQRDRRKTVPDPYSSAGTAPGEWGDADSVTIANAWVASSSSSSTRDATRVQILTAKSLFCQPDADVRAGDRIRVDGETYYIRVKPAADRNPFTGWRPVLEVPVEEVSG
jgi:hypothetical protein